MATGQVQAERQGGGLVFFGIAVFMCQGGSLTNVLAVGAVQPIVCACSAKHMIGRRGVISHLVLVSHPLSVAPLQVVSDLTLTPTKPAAQLSPPTSNGWWVMQPSVGMRVGVTFRVGIEDRVRVGAGAGVRMKDGVGVAVRDIARWVHGTGLSCNSIVGVLGLVRSLEAMFGESTPRIIFPACDCGPIDWLVIELIGCCLNRLSGAAGG
jgi:hypothetical protein